jgi:hypothetical protein
MPSGTHEFVEAGQETAAKKQAFLTAAQVRVGWGAVTHAPAPVRHIVLMPVTQLRQFVGRDGQPTAWRRELPCLVSHQQVRAALVRTVSVQNLWFAESMLVACIRQYLTLCTHMAVAWRCRACFLHGARKTKQ